MTELKIMDMKQVAFYITHGVQPVRIDVGFKDKLVFIYTKEATNNLFTEWLKLCKAHKNKLNSNL